VPDGVDAAVDRVEAAGGDPRVDRSTSEAHLDELPASYNPVLASGESGDHPIHWAV
jgi:hypothetical protein